jgi:hypothetical protein
MRDPVYEGVNGRAYEGTLPPDRPPVDTTVESWIIHAPRIHPWWTWYALHVVSLSDVPGVPAANKHFPDASHEIMLLALQSPPANDNVPDPEDFHTWKPYMPPNAVVQVKSMTDAQAAEVCKLAARGLVDGALPFEPSDYLGGHDLWTQSISMTAEHVRTGVHSEDRAEA